MLNTIYSTQASQRSTLEKMQMDLNAISALMLGASFLLLTLGALVAIGR